MMPMRTMLCAAIVATALTPVVVAAETAAPGSVLAAYSVVVPTSSGDTVASARVVVQGTGSACPDLVPIDGSGDPVSTQGRTNPDPTNFPIEVCEAIVTKPMMVAGTEQVVPSLPDKIETMILIGDSGCKPKDQDGCDPGSKAWPFQQIATSAVSDKPDLVFHVGDYNYRGTPGHIEINGEKQQVYDAGDNTDSVSCKLAGPYFGQNSVGSDSPDQWENWWQDFFQSAATLLAAAPWIVARGNHELCSRAGPGWFYLLDSGSNIEEIGTRQPVCPAAESEQPLVFDEPYRVDLPGWSVVVLDSANACDQGDLHQDHFDKQFESIQGLVDQAPDESIITLISHRPIWAVRKADDTTAPGHTDPSGKYAFIDQTLQQAYHKYPLPRPLELVMSGHMHRFQAIGFARDSQDPYPDQLVVGNSGVALAHNHPDKPFSFPIDGLTGTGFGLSKFGYMKLEPSKNHSWKGTLRDPSGKKLASCEGGKGSKKTGPCAPE